MKRYSFIVFIFLLPMIVSSQNNANTQTQLKISVVQLLNVINPAVEISYEKFHNKRFSTQLSIGLATNVIGKPYKNLKGYSIGIEEKYFVKMNSKSGRYFSLNLNFNKRNHDKIISGLDSITNTIVIDPFSIERKSFSLSTFHGWQVYGKHFVSDFSIGAGIRYRNVQHLNRIFAYPMAREPFDLIRNADTEKKGFVVFIPINIRLGYRF